MSDIIVKSAVEIRDDMLRAVKNGLIESGVVNPNVSVSSDFGIIASAVANEVAIAENNVLIAGNQLMPDTATGTDLDRILSYYSIGRRPASSAIGNVIITASATTLIPTGAQLVSPTGLKYAVVTGGSYADQASIQIISIDTGSQTNLLAGTSLTWVASPPFVAPTVLVDATNVVTGGTDAEDDETARARLLDRLANPPGAGNPSQLIGYAIASDSHVQSAFVGAAARGPSTVDITVAGYATATSKSRTVDATLLANKITPFITGQVSQGFDVYVTNVINYPIDVSLALSLPDPVTANPAGTGGGFIDPSPLAVTTAKPALRVIDATPFTGAANTSTSFYVDCPVAPTAGTVYNISYLSPVTWTLYSAQTNGVYTNTVAGHSNLYLFTINTPFYQNAATNQIIQPGNWIFPTAFNTQVYVNAYLTFMASMGPGERTNLAGLIPRAYRLPKENVSWPYKLNTRVLKPIISSDVNVFDGSILFRGSGGSLDTGVTQFVDYGSLTTNSDPAFALYAPQTAYLANGTSKGDSYIFVPQNFALYKQQ
jgi:uncharacterized phage protein gp47/JayE